MSKRRSLRQTRSMLTVNADETAVMPGSTAKPAGVAGVRQNADPGRDNRLASAEPAIPRPDDHLRRSHRLRIRLRVRRKRQYKVALYGDSISKGIVWDGESGRYRVIADNYAALVGQKLKGTLSNRAMFGMTMGKATARSAKDLDLMKPEERPDMVLVEYGGNDCDFDLEAIARDPAAHHGPKTDISLFRDLLRALIVRFSSRHVLPVLLTLPPLDADRYFSWVSRNSPEAAANILAWLGSISKIYWWQERYNAAVLEVASETGTHVIDIRSAFLREPDYRDYLCADGIHPNGAGHALIAARVGDWLERFCGRMLRGAKDDSAGPVAECSAMGCSRGDAVTDGKKSVARAESDNTDHVMV
jgi:acyl-CoA thioesterase I